MRSIRDSLLLSLPHGTTQPSPPSHSLIPRSAFFPQRLPKQHVGMNWFLLYSKKRAWPLVHHPPKYPSSPWSSKEGLYCSQHTASCLVLSFGVFYPMSFINPGPKQVSSCIYSQYVIITWFAHIFCFSSNIMSFYKGSDIEAKSQGLEISLSCMFTLDGRIQHNAGLSSFPGRTSGPATLVCPVYRWRETQNICSFTQCFWTLSFTEA